MPIKLLWLMCVSVAPGVGSQQNATGHCRCKDQWSAHGVPSCLNQQSCPDQACDQQDVPWCLVENPGCYEEVGRSGRYYCGRHSEGRERCAQGHVLVNFLHREAGRLWCSCVPFGSSCFGLGQCELNPWCEELMAEPCKSELLAGWFESTLPGLGDGSGQSQQGTGGPLPNPGANESGSGGDSEQGQQEAGGPARLLPGRGRALEEEGGGAAEKPGTLPVCRNSFRVPGEIQAPMMKAVEASGFANAQLNTWYGNSAWEDIGDCDLCGDELYLSADFSFAIICNTGQNSSAFWTISAFVALVGKTNLGAALAQSEQDCSHPLDEELRWSELDGCMRVPRPGAGFRQLGMRPFSPPAWTTVEKRALRRVLGALAGDRFSDRGGAHLALSSDFVGAESYSPCRALARSASGFECLAGEEVALYRLWVPNIAGHLPPEIGLLTGLMALEVEGSEAQGSATLPRELGDLKRLQILGLGSLAGALQGPIPREVARLQNLVKLKLSGNSISGPIPEGLASLSLLHVLELQGNRLTGAIPAAILRLPLLRRLDLSQNQLSGFPAPPPGIRRARPCPQTLLFTCPAGTYLANSETSSSSPYSVFECAECPLAMTSAAAAESSSACYCDPSFSGMISYSSSCGCTEGHYLDRLASSCQPCVDGLRCTWNGNGTMSLFPPQTKAGYWAAPVQNIETFAGHDVYLCFSKKTCLGGGECAAGRTGPACSGCLPGRHGGSDGECMPCDADPMEQRLRIALGALAIVPFLVPVAVVLRVKSNRKFSKLLRRFRVSARQLLKYMQLVVVVSGFSVSWPLEMDFFWMILRAFSFNIYAPLGCLAEEQTMLLRTIISWLLPLVFVFLCMLTVPLGAVLCCALRRMPVGRLRKWSEQVRITFMDVLTLIYFFWTVSFAAMLKMSICYLTCRQSPNGKMMVVDFPDTECYKDDRWWQLFPGTVVCMLFYVLGYLVLTWCLLRLVTLELKATKGLSMGRWFFVCDGFRKSHVNWPLVMAAKDVAISFMSIAFAGDGTSQVLASACVMAGYLSALARAMPFDDESLNVMELWGMGSVLCTLFFVGGLGFQLPPEDLVERGMRDPALLSRAIWLLIVMLLGLIVPAMVMFYQLALLIPWISRRLPSCLLPVSPEERAERLQDIQEQMGKFSPRLLEVVQGMDNIEWQRFDYALSCNHGSAGIIDPAERKLLGIARLRWSTESRVSRKVSETRLEVSQEPSQQSRVSV